MRAGIKLGYRSTLGDVSFKTVGSFLEYVEFQRKCAKDMQDDSVNEEVTQVVFIMKKSDIGKLITDLKINGMAHDVHDFAEKANMGDDTNIIWRGQTVTLDQVQLKLYHG